MTSVTRRRADEALAWVRRLQDPDLADWDAHLAWLEADPANAAAFDEASRLIETATDGLAPATRPAPIAPPVNDNCVDAAGGPPEYRSPRRRWWAGLGVATAAAIIAAINLPSLWPGTAEDATIETAANQQRTLAFADGTRIALNGGSLIRLSHGDPRTVAVERGEAFFQVAHDAAHPFTVRAGQAVFQDVGTAFDVVHDGGVTDLAVRDGAVLYDPAGRAVRLDRGQAMTVAPGGTSVRQVDANGVGLWQRGRLSYSDASLTTVARDIARSIGQPVSVDRTVGDRRFSGVIVIEADRPHMFRRLAAVAGVAIERDGPGWRMVSPTR